MFKQTLINTLTKTQPGDRVAKWTKALVATHTDASSKPRPREPFFFWHGRYLRVPTKKSAKVCKNVFKPTIPSHTVKNYQMAQ